MRSLIRILLAGGVIIQLTAQSVQEIKNCSEIWARGKQSNLDLEDRLEEDFYLAKEFGIKAMHQLYNIEEPKLFSHGVFLADEHPARYVAAFNRQSEEAKRLARVAYAALKGSGKLAEKYANLTDPVTSQLVREFASTWSSRGAGFPERCPRSDQPTCPPASQKYRTADGSCNNLEHLWWGSAMSTMQRFLDPVYGDGIESIRRSRRTGRPLPSPRDISVLIHEDRNIPLASVTHMLMQWGQFVDHDITAAAQSRGFNGTFPQCCRNRGAEFQPPEFMHPDCLPIIVNPQDRFFGKQGVRCLEFVRSGPSPRENCGFGPREQLSQVTSFIDASMVYSNNVAHSDSLRIFRNGLLQYGKIQSRKPLLPKGEPDDLCRRGSLSTNCFRAGDARLSEQPALTSLHVVFLRLHNRVATELAALNSHWSDEKLFQESRKIVGALMQHVTYREYLPIVLGPEVMKIFDLELLRDGYYNGYDSTTNPNIANSFSAAAYRFGHSLVQPSFARYGRDHRMIFQNITIHEEFSNRVDLQSVGSVDRILLGLVNQPSQRRDEFITEELTNHLFQIPGFSFGMDLASINIQRGRDHGLAPYIDWRQPCGLSSVKNWKDLERVTSISAARSFSRIYETIEDIDLFSGGLAEKPVVGGLVGPTFACIIAQQFSNLRKGDRFWYENSHSQNSFTIAQLKEIRQISLAKILCKTLDNIDTIQPFVFLTTDNLRNRRVLCKDERLGQLNLHPWAEGKRERGNSALQSNAVTEESVNMPFGRKDRADRNEAKMFPWQRPKPVRTNVNQKNRIIVKRPFFSQDNVTIVVQNHAVNSPVFVTDAIYNSQVQDLQQLPSNPLSHSPQINYPGSNPSLTHVNDQTNYPYPEVASGGFPGGVNPLYSPTNPPHGVNSGYQTGGGISLGGSSFGYHTAQSPPAPNTPGNFEASEGLQSYGNLAQQPLIIPNYPAGTKPYVSSYSGYPPQHDNSEDPNPRESTSTSSTHRPHYYNIPQLPYHSHGYHQYQSPNNWLKPIYHRNTEDTRISSHPTLISTTNYNMRANSKTVPHKDSEDINYDVPKPFLSFSTSKSDKETLIIAEKHVNSPSDFIPLMKDTYSSSNELPRPLSLTT
ncbi:chorion peroxidase isoform X2 [Fopius arisanus]|uniref:Chorion peroxidase isoform X2 n=1 Tax=Fopius arisanus TaxID=64838 RepID=A0A9R1TWR9_9HYME|nr:PREDICTED: chorion peroxidase-like isoform X2 [Fopius arisanus]